MSAPTDRFAAEVLKMTTVRSARVFLVVSLLGTILPSLLIAYVSRGTFAAEGDSSQTALLAEATLGLQFSLLPIALFGASIGAADFTTGMIRHAYLATPGRVPTLWAKLLAGAAVVSAPTFALLTVSFVAVAMILDPGHALSLLTLPRTVTTWLGCGLAILTAMATGTHLGWLTRSTGGAVAAVIGIMIIAPIAASALPYDDQRLVAHLDLGTALSALTSPHPALPTSLTAVALVTATLTALSIVAARRRDV